VLVDGLLAAAGVVGLGWVALRRDGFTAAERTGSVLLCAGLATTGVVGLAGLADRAGVAGQTLAAVFAAAGFYLLVVRGDGMPREAAESDPADVPEDWDEAFDEPEDRTPDDR